MYEPLHDIRILRKPPLLEVFFHYCVTYGNDNSNIQKYIQLGWLNCHLGLISRNIYETDQKQMTVNSKNLICS